MATIAVAAAGEPKAEKAWHAAYPAAKNTAQAVSRKLVLSWIQKGQIPGKDFVLVDLRRTDFEGGSIHGSINLPAQSLYPTIPALCTLFQSAGVSSVVWYCASSRGRGNRAAGWFADYLKDKNITTLESLLLEDGIKGWVAGGDEYTELMDEYVPAAWN